MKFKKIMLLAIFLVSLLAVSAVSAADNATSDVVSVDESINEIVNVEENNQVTEQSENEETIHTTDEATFTVLQSKINSAAAGSTITLENDYSYDEGFSTDGIRITKDLTINGNGHTINGLSKSRIFSLSYDTVKKGVSDNFKLTLVNVNFLNGYSTGDGGAIKADSGVLYDISILNSYWYSWELDISNCRFDNNKAAGSDGTSTGIGGAINTYDKLTIRDSTFTNNIAKNYGGAIYSGNKNNHDVLICSNCIFTNNKVEGYGGGGALHIYYDSVFNDCTFTGNEAASYAGGALYTTSDIEINRCSFSDNKAKDGGAVFTFDYNVIISDSTFTSNKASRNGGAVYSNEGQSIRNCEFISNQASNYGGAVYYSGKVTTTSSSSQTTSIYTNMIENSTFKDNAADSTGGAIYCVLYTVKDKTYGGNAEGCIFENNNADSCNDVYGTTTTNCIFKMGYKLLANDVVKYCGGSEKYTVTLTNKDGVIANAKVKISIDGKAQTVKTNSKGQASVDLNLGVGNHDVVAEYEDAKHTSKVTVKSTITASDMTGTYSNSKATATFLNTAGKALANTKVTFKIGTSSYSATTNSNGAASASIPLGVGTYTVTAVNPTNNEEKQFKLTISKADSKIALVSSQNNGFVTLTATLTPEAATGNVVFNVNGEDKSAAIKNGKATLTLSNLEPGDYSVSASYNGDKNLKASASNAVTFNVAEVYPILTADPVTKTYGTSTKLVVNLVDSKGNAIANADVNVVINGQVTPITTDSSGQATMSINKAPGLYTAAIAYVDAQTTAKITVKKATPKLTAKAKAFKKSVKTKKYTVTLKTNQNKVMKNTKLTLKVNGKTYKATTNTKGQATFKITKLTKKGKFTVVVKFAGNKYYNAKTAKPIITVK